jgi:hypothetical protein
MFCVSFTLVWVLTRSYVGKIRTYLVLGWGNSAGISCPLGLAAQAGPRRGTDDRRTPGRSLRRTPRQLGAGTGVQSNCAGRSPRW